VRLVVGLCVCAATVGQAVSITLGSAVRRDATVAGSPVSELTTEVAARLVVGPCIDTATVGQAVAASLGRMCCRGLYTIAEGGSPAVLPAGIVESCKGGGDGIELVEKLILLGVEREGDNGLRGNV
jgi:hypothetical protein